VLDVGSRTINALVMRFDSLPTLDAPEVEIVTVACLVSQLKGFLHINQSTV
jgi:hypothetical protein